MKNTHQHLVFGYIIFEYWLFPKELIVSFVYAEKNYLFDGSGKQSINILSDTKTTLIGAVLSNWTEKEINTIKNYGFLKSIIIGPKCCISFAGNNTIFAQKLLSWIFDKKIVSEGELIEKAYEIHSEAEKDDIEFIICSSDSEKPIITCIKEGTINNDVSSTWIGSRSAFNTLQKLRTSSYTDIRLFKKAIDECGDDSVGGFVINCIYNGEKFIYPERLETCVSRNQTVKPGESFKLYDTAENGGYTAYFRESNCDVIIDFEQIDISVIYTARLRYEEDKNMEFKKHLMLPFVFCTSTNKLI
ncbi:MAG: hypothetical protein J6F31_04905 [Oscillospiraceae bacterium]|nr:hypothetical protein [Oscillospiraceae bacterium]